MIGKDFWSTGINVKFYKDGEFGVSLNFYDSGFAESGSAEGELRCRYTEKDLSKAIDTLVTDAKKIGIVFRPIDGAPMLYTPGDGEWGSEYYPPGWRNALKIEADRIGWKTYDAE